MEMKVQEVQSALAQKLITVHTVIGVEAVRVIDRLIDFIFIYHFFGILQLELAFWHSLLTIVAFFFID